MMTIEQNTCKFVKMNVKELKQIDGGSILSFIDSCTEAAISGAKGIGLWGAAVGWFVWETLTNPIESYNSFMSGWNAR
jgi:hypothetical protein